MYDSGDEIYGDDVTSGLLPEDRAPRRIHDSDCEALELRHDSTVSCATAVDAWEDPAPAPDRMAGARAAFASLIQRDAWMLNRYGTGARCPIVLDGAGAYACLVHEDGTAEATSTRCSEAERLARIAAEPGPSYLGIEL